MGKYAGKMLGYVLCSVVLPLPVSDVCPCAKYLYHRPVKLRASTVAQIMLLFLLLHVSFFSFLFHSCVTGNV